jgi:hypothetical protein
LVARPATTPLCHLPAGIGNVGFWIDVFVPASAAVGTFNASIVLQLQPYTGSLSMTAERTVVMPSGRVKVLPRSVDNAADAAGRHGAVAATTTLTLPFTITVTSLMLPDTSPFATAFGYDTIQTPIGGDTAEQLAGA